MTGSAAQAADITQDVFVELLSTSSRYDGTRGSLAAYLCGIARFRAYRAADPRMQSVENIKREEPSAELFKVPADFELKTAPAPGGAERR